VAQGTCADEAIQIAREVRPDVMLLDITMPGGGLRAAAHILADAPHSKIILLTASDEEEQLSEAIALGVKGYVLKAGAVNESVAPIPSVIMVDINCFEAQDRP
jgi:DNA-binding NarL/FixJ family response regulator